MKTCPGCGAQFLPRPTTQKFCSAQCAVKHRPRNNRKTCVCEWCKKPFETWISRPGRFCSGQCRTEFAAHQPKPHRIPAKFITQNCAFCGEPYTIKETQKRLRNGRYCSLECKYKALSETKRGSGNINYRGGKIAYRGPNWGSQKRAAMKRDGFKCAICGEKRERGKWNIGVHHIKPYREFGGDWEAANQLSNLITLCRSCHSKVEFGHLPCPQPLF